MIVNESVAGLPGAGVTGDARVTLTPAGAVPTHDVDNVTADLNPFKEVRVMFATPVLPGVNVTEGFVAIEKSGEPLVVLFVSIVVVWFVSGPVTVRFAEAESSLGVPVAVTS